MKIRNWNVIAFASRGLPDLSWEVLAGVRGPLSGQVHSTRFSIIKKGGEDATEEALRISKEIIDESTSALLLPSVFIAMFNPIDPEELNRELEIPVIVLTIEKPTRRFLDAILKHEPRNERKRRLAERFEDYETLELAGGRYYYRSIGAGRGFVYSLLKSSIKFGRSGRFQLPEIMLSARHIAEGIMRSILDQSERKLEIDI